MTPSYFYEYMHITNTEPVAPIVVPKGYNIKPGKQKPASAPATESPVTIQVPDIKPIEYHGMDLNVALGTILKTLSALSAKKFYGITMLVDVLRGSQSKRIQADGLAQADGYGSLANVKREDVQYLVEWLIENGFILKTRGQYPVLHLTYNGEHYSEVISRQKIQVLKKKLESTSSSGQK